MPYRFLNANIVAQGEKATAKRQGKPPSRRKRSRLAHAPERAWARCACGTGTVVCFTNPPARSGQRNPEEGALRTKIPASHAERRYKPSKPAASAIRENVSSNERLMSTPAMSHTMPAVATACATSMPAPSKTVAPAERAAGDEGRFAMAVHDVDYHLVGADEIDVERGGIALLHAKRRRVDHDVGGGDGARRGRVAAELQRHVLVGLPESEMAIVGGGHVDGGRREHTERRRILLEHRSSAPCPAPPG